MYRTALVLLLTLGLAIAPQAQPVPRIAWVLVGNEETMRDAVAAVRQGLADSGLHDGENVVLERRYAQGQITRYPALFAELAERRPDVFMAAGLEGIRAAQSVAAGKPVIGYFCGNDVADMVASLARPGSNTTGVSCLNEQLAVKRLELLKEAVPAVKYVAYLHGPGSPGNARELEEVRRAATRLGLSLTVAAFVDAAGIANTLATLKRDGIDAVMLPESLFAAANYAAIAQAALVERVPGIFSYRQFVLAGGTLSYGPSIGERLREWGRQIGRVLKGAEPSSLPIDQPTRFELVVNRSTAGAIGVRLDDRLVMRADEVIE
jgi:putative ABC transport system substrate-binding protein